MTPEREKEILDWVEGYQMTSEHDTKHRGMFIDLLVEIERLKEMNEAKGRLIKMIIEANETDADWMRKGLALCLKTKAESVEKPNHEI